MTLRTCRGISEAEFLQVYCSMSCDAIKLKAISLIRGKSQSHTGTNPEEEKMRGKRNRTTGTSSETSLAVSMEPALYCHYSLACPFSSLTGVSFPQDWNKDALEPQTPRRKDVHTRERKKVSRTPPHGTSDHLHVDN